MRSNEAEAERRLSEIATPPRVDKLKTWGSLGTVFYIIVMVIYAGLVRDEMLAMKPHEFADFLAGIFGPLAFFWLVLGFIQQGDELRNSASALWLQGAELRNSVEQQKGLVKAAQDQLDFEREARLHLEAEADRAAKPTLVLTRTGSATGAEGFVTDFELTNVGTPCTHLIVSFESLDSNSISQGSLGMRESMSLSMRVKHDEVRNTAVIVKYVDARGRSLEQRFPIVVRKEGNRKILVVKFDH